MYLLLAVFWYITARSLITKEVELNKKIIHPKGFFPPLHAENQPKFPFSASSNLVGVVTDPFCLLYAKRVGICILLFKTPLGSNYVSNRLARVLLADPFQTQKSEACPTQLTSG